jgi:hypothetical protein
MVTREGSGLWSSTHCGVTERQCCTVPFCELKTFHISVSIFIIKKVNKVGIGRSGET